MEKLANTIRMLKKYAGKGHTEEEFFNTKHETETKK
jgi:hypothetical protein